MVQIADSILAGRPCVLAGALPAPLCARWLAAVQPHADRARPLAGHPALDADEILRAVADSTLAEPIRQALGPAPLCNLSQSWVRHGRPAHWWHQDGALAFDFLAHADRPLPADALLEMVTCWIALTPCGDDAPGLEWIAEPMPGLLPLDALAPAAVQARHPPAAFVHPRLQPGDALLFDGSLLHRTHLTPEMRGQRSSIELRFFRAAAWPTRLAGDRRAPLPEERGSEP